MSVQDPLTSLSEEQIHETSERMILLIQMFMPVHKRVAADPRMSSVPTEVIWGAILGAMLTDLFRDLLE